MKEFEHIEWVHQQVKPARQVDVGIGDDAAIIHTASGDRLAIAVDTILEGVHFDAKTPPKLIGRKSLAVNLSDIAAMAGQPMHAVVGIAFNRQAGPQFAREVQQGILDLADEFNVALIGGDTNVWDQPLAISVTVIACEPPSGFVLRSGAQAGDAILVTGSLGGSLQGKHLDFTPRVSEALILAESYPVHSLIDISDGLASDLGHILRQSDVGAEVQAASLPIAACLLESHTDKPKWEHALSDGEDFELLLTLPESAAEGLLNNPPFSTPLTRVGTILEDSAATLILPDGSRRKLNADGWEHSFD